MNKTKLKAYAPKARKDFIAAVTARANLLGLSDNSGNLEVAAGERKGDISIIAGREWPVKVYSQREDLIKRMTNEGFSQTVEAVAYTWFNRFAALRFMEIHDYLDHGHRALSNREGGMPEILNHAAELDLPGLNKAKTVELKLAGNKDNDLYKLILVAQCNALSSAIPFLFERIDDETELLLPDNLLLTDSVIAKLVADIPEEDWQEVEIIGWLYQFYISEKKDEVIGKVVKSEDIPAATQLFTPNWIVQYLVQNSVGRLWMMANPSSTLKSQWPYYIEPAEQTPEVQAQLNALIHTRMDEDGGSLNPETITVLDPACGSGHILVEAYNILKAIYLERGYQPRTIPRLILERNLFGIDIDDRAAQMAGFALLMKARADDRRLFDSPPKLNVLSLQESKGLGLEELISHLGPLGIKRLPLTKLLEIFAPAKNFGSLIKIPQELNVELVAMAEALQQALQKGDLYTQAAAEDILPLVNQCALLGMQFDAVVANPPYMGSKGMNPVLKSFAKRAFPDSKSDLFAMFIERGFTWCKPSGFNSMVTMQGWMFLSSYESFRRRLLRERQIVTMAHLGARAFPEISGEVVQTTAFVLLKYFASEYKPSFFRLIYGNDEDKRLKILNGEARLDSCRQADFRKIPGEPVAYWVTNKELDIFESFPSIGSRAAIRAGMATGNNDRHIRLWYEIDISKLSTMSESAEMLWADTKFKWIPFNKGGEAKKWYGNLDYVINYDKSSYLLLKESGNQCPSEEYYFRDCLTWSDVTSGPFGARFFPKGSVFSSVGNSIFETDLGFPEICCNLISKPVVEWLKVINPTLHANPGDVARLPLASPDTLECEDIFKNAVSISKANWDGYEVSWDFKNLDVIANSDRFSTLCDSFKAWSETFCNQLSDIINLEERNNRLFINAFGLQDELSPEVHEDQITLTHADREKDCQRLISYFIGCMMGRYSLDEPSLIYAHAGNVGFEPSRYVTFPADADGIVPITDTLWFEDDAANRIREFLLAVWSAETLDKNMTWLAESLGNKGNETPEETIRRYLASSFYKNHLQTYKKRPIYWLFSSGKQGAFQALVYLHRYNEGTLARMRSEYVVPLTGKMLSRIEMLEKDAAAVNSPAARTKINKEIEAIRKQHIELLSYDEKLRHYADMRINLDLDDGVKVNYGKFGDLLADVKVVTGGVDE